MSYLENLGQLPVQAYLKGTDNCILWIHNIRVFEVRESIADISTKLSCLGNLENSGKLPVQNVLGGTGESVL